MAPLVRWLYAVKAPFVIFSVLVFVLSLAILESGRDTAQRVVFGVLALINVVVQLAWGCYLGYRLYTLSRTTPPSEEDPSIGKFLDSWFALMLAWGMAAMAFWVIDTSVDRDHYWAFENEHLVNPHNNWVTALDFIFDMTHPMTATSIGEFNAVSIWSRLMLWVLEVFHLFYLALGIAIVGINYFDKEREKRKELQQHHQASSSSAYQPLPEVITSEAEITAQLVARGKLPPHLVIDSQL